MRAVQLKSLWGGVAASALLFTYGCGATPNAAGIRAPEAASAQPSGSPIVVSCEPHQRTLVRPVVVNGAAISQVECIAADPQALTATPLVAPVQPQAYAAPRAQTVYADMAPAQVVPVSTQAARPVRTNQVVYREPVKKNRSVKKSAVIIGSSAAVGAGVGAVTGGKKGALIGAAIGGGGAAIWDQVTRRR